MAGKSIAQILNKSSEVKQSDMTSGLIIQSWPPMINIHLSSDQDPCDIPLYWLLNKDNDIHRQLHSMHEYVAKTFLFYNAGAWRYKVSA